jgi:hypothetical protein
MNKFDPIELLGDIGMYINNCLDDVESLLSITKNKQWREDLRANGDRIGYKCSINESDKEYEIIHSAMIKAAGFFLNSTNRSINDYEKVYNFYKIFQWETPMSEMAPHADSWIADGETIVPDISLVMYLTSDFEGGELSFTDLNKKIKPKSGDIVVFDSASLHGVEPVLSGRRITTQLFLKKIAND